MTRKEAIHILDNLKPTNTKSSFDAYVVGKAISMAISALSAEPKTGRWIRMSDLPEDKDDRYKCSQCGNVVHRSNGVNLYTFNSWCGRCGSLNNSLLAGLEPYKAESENI